MDITLFPTKGNLILAKNSLRLSKQGYELLDKKRNVLIREMMDLIERAKEIQQGIRDTFAVAYDNLRAANIMLGISNVEQISFSVPPETRVGLHVRSVMGVEIPMLERLAPAEGIPYGAYRTAPSLDNAYRAFDKVKRMTIELAEVENSVYRLAAAIKKTQKRANALKNIMIPRYEKISAEIQSALEEKEREEFSRLKVIKRSNSMKE